MFQVFLFCESAMIALWDGKQVETAFFLQIYSIMYKKVTRGGVFASKILSSHPHVTEEMRSSCWDGSDQKGRKSKSGVVPARWGGHGGGQQAIAATASGKIKATAAIVILQTAALTPQLDGNLQKKTWSHKKFSGSQRNRCLCDPSTPLHLSLFFNVFDATQNAEFILISWNHWMLSGNTASKIFVLYFDNFCVWL
jgi:hypothetical protein